MQETEPTMNAQFCSGRDKLFAKITGQLAFLNIALTSLKQADIGEKVLSQMHRGVTAIRGTLRGADSPVLEAFVCDLEDLLRLLCAGEIRFTADIVQLVRQSTAALGRGIEALQQGVSAADAVDEVRNEVFAVLLDHAVTVRR